MDLIAILSTVILLVTIGTIMVALAAYGAVKVRDKRKPKLGKAASTDEAAVFQPEFLQRYMPPAKGEETETAPIVTNTNTNTNTDTDTDAVPVAEQVQSTPSAQS